MDHNRISTTSMSSVYSGSSVSNTPTRQAENTMNVSGSSEVPAPFDPYESLQGLRATTIGTVVVRCGSIQLVIALLQSPDKIFIKVVNLEPKITTLGANLEESLQMKNEHEQIMVNIEDLPGPMEEFLQKANDLLASKRINVDVVNAMSDTLNIIWRDTIYLLNDRQQLLQKSTIFHEKMTICQNCMDQLEAACIDTMLPIEVNTVQDVLNKFKQLRIDMLTAVMAALKEGNDLLALLHDLAEPDSPGTRPDHIKRDAARAEHQVQLWLETLHDRRNGLEIAWQTRKTQLEQCLALALLTRELQDVEIALQKQRVDVMSIFSLGECEQTANNALHNYSDFKRQAQILRDRALKITRGKEKLQASGTFSGDEACAKTYDVLSKCTEHLDLVDQREHWLQQAREFFNKGNHTLNVLKKLEKELTRAEHNNNTNTSESYAIFVRMSKDVNRFTEESLRLGNTLLNEVGPEKSEASGVKRLLDELINIKKYIEGVCAVYNEGQQRIHRAMDEFEAKYNDLLNWLTTSGQMYLKQYVHMGRNLEESKHFLLQHHELMQDLEIKGELINLLLETIKSHLETFTPQQRYEVDCKAESLHKHWIELKDLVLKRVDYVSILTDFYEKAKNFSSQLNNLNIQLQNKPDEQKLQYLKETWSTISNEYASVKAAAKRFTTLKILDPYIDVQSSVAAVEEIIDGFSKRQVDVTKTLESWTTQLDEKREIELILEKIMCENEEAAAKTKKVDTQLYPVFTTASVDAKELLSAVNEKLELVLLDIDKAQQEIQERVKTTIGIRTNDRESQQKIEQVVSNLETLKSKLDGIKLDYRNLLEAILNYLKNIDNLTQEIDNHFGKLKRKEELSVENTNTGGIERTISEHEHFRETCMVKFRAIITQSELLIDRIRIQEPPGAREIDADRILVILENLRTTFESNCSQRMSNLKRLEKLEQFRCDLNDIHSSLDSVCKQLNEINGQNMDSLASAKTTSLAFEYFERTIELLEKRIDQLSETSKDQAKHLNTENKEYVNKELNKLNDKWANFKAQVRQKRNALDHTVEFYEETEKIDSDYRELSYFYDSLSNKIPYIRDPVEASNLVNDIEKHVISREKALVDKLNSLTKDSPNPNKVSILYNEIRTLFQSFTKLKFDINIVEERIKKEQREKEAQEKIYAQTTPVLQTELLPAHAERLQNLQDEIDHHRIVSQNIRKEIQVNQIFTEMKYVAPFFTRPLQDATTREGDKFTFECEVRGNPEPNIEWFKDGISIQNNLDYKTSHDLGVCRLLIDETFTADSGNFSCRAANVLGTADTTAMLSVRENAADVQMVPPHIERFLESGKAKEGSSFEFVCLVTGIPLPTVQWFKNDKCIDDLPDYVISYNNGEAKLRFEEVFLEDDAYYTCRVSNPVGIAQCSATLKVEPLEPTAAPHFVAPLSNVMGRVGQKIKLEAVVNGIPTPEIYWMHNNKLYYPRESKYENGRVTLIISQAYPSDAGIYVLTAKNLAGEISCACNVIVKGLLPNETSDSELASDMEPIRPTVQLPLKNISVIEGKPVRLDCVIVGQPEPEVIWYHNDRPVKESTDIQLLFQGDRCSLIMHEAYHDDAGDYKVVAINSAGEASSKCEIKVMPVNVLDVTANNQKESEKLPNGVPPTFEKFLSDVLADEGQTIELDVVVKGDQPISAKWYLINNELIENERISMVTNIEKGIFKLIIQNVNTDDKGVYTVKINNTVGEAKCFSNLIVKSVNVSDTQRQQQQQQQVNIIENNQRPEFKELFHDKGACIDDIVKFECIVKGKPTPKVRWYFNDQPVQGHNFWVSTSGERQVLTIHPVSTDTVGKISCVAENEIGKATCEAFLSLHGSGLQFSQPGTSNVHRTTEEYSSGSSMFTIKKQSFQSSTSSKVNTFEGNMPQRETYQSYAYVDNQPPEVESHRYEEVHKIKDLTGPHRPSDLVLTSTNVQTTSAATALGTPTRVRKQIAPRFTTPLQGKIVDQGADVNLEAIYDGFPSPVIKVEKNGEQLFDNDRIKIGNKCNRVTIDLKEVGVPDAGRYAITATNIVGESTSTADLVVKKTIFPPVFGRRLQAQVSKKGEQIIMEVEVTGLPEPTVTWKKDEKPLNEAGLSTYRLISLGNSHKLIIEKGQISDSGKYMVIATNAGGEARSIADCAILEPSPERLQEVVKTVVYQQPTDFKTKDIEKESLTSTTQQPDIKNSSEYHGISESKIITEHRCTMEATMRLEHKSTPLDLPALTVRPKTPAGQDTTDAKPEQIQIPPIKSPSYHIPVRTENTANQASPQTDYENITKSQKEITTQHVSSEENIKSSLYDLLARSENKRTELYHKINEPHTQAESKSIEIAIKLTEPKPLEIPRPLPESRQIEIPVHLPEPMAVASMPIDVPIKPIEPKYVEIPIKIPDFTPKPVDTAAEKYDFNLEPGSPPEICFMPKRDVSSNVEASFEKFVESVPVPTQSTISVQKTETPAQLYSHSSFATKEVKVDYVKPIIRPAAILVSPAEKMLRSPSPKHSAEGAAMSRLWAKPSHTTSYKSDSETENKSLSFVEKFSSTNNELNAPFLVKEATESISATKLQNYPQLEPGSPPEICFAPKTTDRRQSLVETMEKTLEKNLLQGPTKVLPHSIPTLTPPSASPANTQKQLGPKPPPPTMPTMVQLSAPRQDFYESDYESDRYKYSGSESDDTSLRPKLQNLSTNINTSSVPVAQTQPVYHTPVKISGYAADTEDPSNHYTPYTTNYTSSSYCEIKSSSKLPYEKQPPAPIYYANNSNGYEPQSEKENLNEKQDYYTASQTSNISYKTATTPIVPVKIEETTVKTTTTPSVSVARHTPAEFSDYSSEVEERFRSVSRNYESETDIKGYRVVFPPTPTPTKAVSNIGNGHKSPVVVVTPSPMEFERPQAAVSSFSRPKFEPIQNEKSKEYQHTIQTNQFQKETQQYQQEQQQQQQQQFKQQHQQQQHVFKPKPVAAKFIAATQQRQQEQVPPSREKGATLYYNAYAGTPLHTAKLATETTNLTELESSNTCQRVVNMQRTKQVYHFESQQEKRSCSSQYESYSSPSRASTPAHQVRLPKPATPTKFVPCEFKESGYKNEVDNAKIRPLWSPYGDQGYLRYRHVEAPKTGGRAASLPRSYERVLSPMEFDHGPEMPTNLFGKLRQEQELRQPKTQSLQRHSSLRSSSQSQQQYENAYQKSSSSSTKIERTHFPKDDMGLKVGSPPKYGYVSAKANDHGKHMQSTFMQKSCKFIENISNDMTHGRTSTPVYHQQKLESANKRGESVPQAYRDETRVSQYGTKCVDPNTGLVYFKYDFGYEFGILFPGEGHKFVEHKWSSSEKKTPVSGGSGGKHVRYSTAGGDLIIPVQHERSISNASPYLSPSGYQSDTQTIHPQRYAQRKRYSLPTSTIDINIDRLHTKPNTNISVASKRSAREASSDVTNFDDLPKSAPAITTPLKEIAVIAGQQARFECIVVCHPPPTVTWTYNNQILRDSMKHVLEYRNGICRLTLPCAFPDDAGTYACTIVNPFGTVTTMGQLMVQTKNRSFKY